MSGAFWAHSEAPNSIAGSVLGCRQFLASGQSLRAGDDAIHVLRLLLVDGLQTYGRYEGDLRPVSSSASTIHLNLRAPRTARTREILIDALSLHASVMRMRGIPLEPATGFAPTDPAATLAVETKGYGNAGAYPGPTANLPWTAGGTPQVIGEAKGADDAGFVPAIALAGPAAAWTTIAVTGIVSTLVAWIVFKATDSVDNWQRSRAAVDVNLTRQATSYAKLMQVHQDHAAREASEKREIPYSAAELAVIESARRDLEAGRRDAASMADKLTAPTSSATSTTILLLGLAAVAGLVYTRKQ